MKFVVKLVLLCVKFDGLFVVLVVDMFVFLYF